LQNYLASFFGNLGGSPWANIQTQYCNQLLAGSTSCVGGAGFVTNPKKQLKGVWTDPTPVPDDIVTLGLAENLVDDPIAAEAMRASAHFGNDPQATYIILTPPRPVATGQPVYCGYHTQTSSIDGLGNPYRIQYAFIPWQNTNWPGVGTSGCGMHFVNATSNSFGNGIFDGWSIVTGHEYAEAVTDPDNIASWQDGWLDAQGSENGDKCAWAASTSNIALGGHQFAVQPMWSNEAFDATGDGCVMSR
jgi:serine protease